MVNSEVLYFEEPGEHNTEETLNIGLKWAQKNQVNDMLVPSTRGVTGLKAAEIFKGSNLVVITHHTGFREPGHQELENDAKTKITSLGAKILTATHALSGVERAIRKQLETQGPVLIAANTLRLFGQGTKVAVEIALMAADAGLIPVDRPVLCFGGTARGVDTALSLIPTSSSRFFDMMIQQILCKPLIK